MKSTYLIALLLSLLSLSAPMHNPNTSRPIMDSEISTAECEGIVQKDSLHKGMTVNNLVSMIDNPLSFAPNQIWQYSAIGGYIPIDCKLGQSPFVIHSPFAHVQHLFVTVDGNLSDEEFLSLITQKATIELINTKGNYIITSFAVFNEEV
jgi:hypothetical protein